MTGRWKSILKLKLFFKKYRFILLIGILGITVSSLISTPIPYLTENLLDKVLIGNKSYCDLYLFFVSWDCS